MQVVALLSFEKQERWCGWCGEVVVPVFEYVNFEGEKVVSTRPVCPICHSDTRKPKGRSADSPTKQAYIEKHLPPK